MSNPRARREVRHRNALIEREQRQAERFAKRRLQERQDLEGVDRDDPER